MSYRQDGDTDEILFAGIRMLHYTPNAEDVLAEKRRAAKRVKVVRHRYYIPDAAGKPVRDVHH